jgi:hypothetical protein
MARSPGPRRGAANAQSSQSSENGAFEAKLWSAADALRNNMDAAEYKHVVLGLIFLKYISDAVEGKHAELDAQRAQGADPEDPDEYRAQNIFWVPPEARWSYLKSMAPQPTIGQLIDDAMTAIERDNASLKGVLPRTMPAQGSTRFGSGRSSIWSATSRSVPPRIVQRTSSVKSTNTFSPVSPAPRARAAGSFTHPPTSSACWLRCSRPTRGGSTIPAAVPAACSCRARNSSTPMRTATETAARQSLTSQSGARSPITPLGGSPR